VADKARRYNRVHRDPVPCGRQLRLVRDQLRNLSL